MNQARTGDVPVDIGRYEDLVAAPEAEFAKIFATFNITPKLPLADCLALCSPGALRKAEDAEIAMGAPSIFKNYRKDAARPETRFINEARANGYRSVLSSAEVAYGLDRLGGLMERLGYDVQAYRQAA